MVCKQSKHFIYEKTLWYLRSFSKKLILWSKPQTEWYSLLHFWEKKPKSFCMRVGGLSHLLQFCLNFWNYVLLKIEKSSTLEWVFATTFFLISDFKENFSWYFCLKTAPNEICYPSKTFSIKNSSIKWN